MPSGSTLKRSEGRRCGSRSEPDASEVGRSCDLLLTNEQRQALLLARSSGALRRLCFVVEKRPFTRPTISTPWGRHALVQRYQRVVASSAPGDPRIARRPFRSHRQIGWDVDRVGTVHGA